MIQEIIPRNFKDVLVHKDCSLPYEDHFVPNPWVAANTCLSFVDYLDKIL